MQLEKAENPKTCFRLSNECFPFKAKSPGNKYSCENWDDVGKMLLNPTHGNSPIQHVKALSVKVGKNWRPISLESVAFQESVAWHIALYSKANAPYVKSHLFPGELSEQPNILYGEGQAFDTVKAAIDECELENVRTMKRQAKENNG